MKRIIFTLFLATITLTSLDESHGDTIFTAVGGGALGKVNSLDANPGTIVGSFRLTAPQPPALSTGVISGAFNADGTKIYTLINTLAPTKDNVSSQLGVIDDIENGTITPIGEVHPFNIVAIEVDSADNVLATGFDLNPGPFAPLNFFGDSKLYNIDKDSGALTEIGETGIDDPIMDLAIDGRGKLWATSRNKLWTINPNNGLSKFEVDITGISDDGSPPIPAEIMSIYFDSNDQLLGTDAKTGDLFRIDTMTGEAKFMKTTGWDIRVGSRFPHGGDIYNPPVLPPLGTGDFNGNSNLDVADVDLLIHEIVANTHDPSFDLTDDNVVDQVDLTTWVKDLKQTWFGDANLDGQFNNLDLVAILQAGQYQDGIVGNSTWATGDWNADGEFDRQDIVVALQDGGYGQAGLAAVSAVPEPSCAIFLGVGTIGLCCLRKRR